MAWSIDKFCFHAGGAHVAYERNCEHAVKTSLADTWITDEFSWAFRLMFQVLGDAVTHIMFWLESCACHFDTFSEEDRSASA